MIAHLLFFTFIYFGQIFSFGDFARMPEVPFEATTFEQDALIEKAKEKGSVEACDALIEDQTLPIELRCWAVRQKIELCIFSNRSLVAIEAGQNWLKHNADKDHDPRAIRFKICDIIARNTHGFVQYDQVKEIFNDFFENHPSNDVIMTQAHINYSIALSKVRPENATIRNEIHEQKVKAAELLEHIIGNEELLLKSFRDSLEKKELSRQRSVPLTSDNMKKRIDSIINDKEGTAVTHYREHLEKQLRALHEEINPSGYAEDTTSGRK